MATQIQKRRNELTAEIDALRSTIRSLLAEVELGITPVGIDPEKGIDFYENVARFETHLIELALEMSGGRQNKAARLLRLRKSTLNWKIKKLEIKFG